MKREVVAGHGILRAQSQIDLNTTRPLAQISIARIDSLDQCNLVLFHLQQQRYLLCRPQLMIQQLITIVSQSSNRESIFQSQCGLPTIVASFTLPASQAFFAISA